MSILKMTSVSIHGSEKLLNETLKRCLNSNLIHLIAAESEHSFSQNESYAYQKTLTDIISMSGRGAFELKKADTALCSQMTYEEMASYVETCSAQLKTLKEKEAKAVGTLDTCRRTLEQLEHISDLDMDLKELFSLKHITTRLGHFPTENISKLSYYENEDFIFIPFDTDKEITYCAYFAPNRSIGGADSIMSKFGFNLLEIPEGLEGTPEIAKQEVLKRFSEAEERKKICTTEKEAFLNQEADKILSIYTLLKLESEAFKLRQYARITDVVEDDDVQGFEIRGYIPSKEEETFRKQFSDLTVTISYKTPAKEDRKEVPVKLKNGVFSRAFSMFVEMYGLPKYGGLNPTALVAITYTIIFGIMFGDVGHGLCVSLVGLLMQKKLNMPLGGILKRVGISSVFFGFIYGSVFGFEEAMDPLYHAIGLNGKPLDVMEHVLPVLGATIGIGAVLITLSMLLNIILRFKNKEYGEALFSSNGVFGFIFYESLLFAIVGTLFFNLKVMNTAYVVFLLIIPAIVMFLREPLSEMIEGKKFKMENPVDFICSNFFELFEFVLSYATNTLSFVRIGGFVFSHYVMMSVVMLLASGASGASAWAVIILGNIFVMILEGMLVCIQVLRLEYYEIFSRFYDGDGLAYRPISVEYGSENSLQIKTRKKLRKQSA